MQPSTQNQVVSMRAVLTTCTTPSCTLHSCCCAMASRHLLQGGRVCDGNCPSDGAAAAACCARRLGPRRGCRAAGTLRSAATAVRVPCFPCFLQPREGADVARQRVTAQLLAARQPHAPHPACE